MIEDDERWRATNAMPGVFGTWDAPATDDLPTIDPPIGKQCIWCREFIELGDNGQISRSGYVEHRECCLRQVMGGIGHLLDHAQYCRGIGPDAGLTHRLSAMMVWDYFQDVRLEPTAEQLDHWRHLLAVAQNTGRYELKT